MRNIYLPKFNIDNYSIIVILCKLNIFWKSHFWCKTSTMFNIDTMVKFNVFAIKIHHVNHGVLFFTIWTIDAFIWTLIRFLWIIYSILVLKKWEYIEYVFCRCWINNMLLVIHYERIMFHPCMFNKVLYTLMHYKLFNKGWLFNPMCLSLSI